MTTPTTYTLTGSVTATNGGQPLPATVTVDGVSANTDGAGRFSVSPPLSGPSVRAVTISGAGLLEHRTWIGSQVRDVPLGAIAMSGGFDLGFYRQLVRDNFDNPGSLKPTRRWTSTPQFYVRTVDEAGVPIDGSTLDMIESTIRDAVPSWTSGRLGTPTVSRGPSAMLGIAGWVTVRFPAETATNACGRSQVAVSGGTLDLYYHSSPSFSCRTSNAVIAPIIVRHEVGHTLGLYHTDNPADVMRAGGDLNRLPSARELYHVAILYSRPAGNTDPDTDPQP